MLKLIPLSALLCFLVFVSLARAEVPQQPPAVVPKQNLPLGSTDHAAGVVDEYFKAVWQQAGLEPVAAVNDAQFLRRVSLALNGRIATAEEVRRFLNDPAPQKRVAKVNELLTRSQYADYWAFRLRDWIVKLREVKGQGTNFTTLYQYAREALAENRGWDRVAWDLLATQGNIALDGRVNMGIYFDGEANEFADAGMRLFLGKNIACAQCHDHPFEEPWSQQSYWGLAAFFARTEMWDINVVGKDKFDERFPEIGRAEASISSLPGGDAAIDGGGGENRAVADIEKGEVHIPHPTEKVVVMPATLGGRVIEQVDEQKLTRREQFAEWLTSRENRAFSRAAVNRLWLELTGHGFVPKFDGFSPNAHVRHEALLDRLADQFAARHYDLKWLMRTIVLSKAFQVPLGEEGESEDTWHTLPRRLLNSDQWFDSVLRATGEDRRIYQIGTEVAQLIDIEQNARVDRRRRLLEIGEQKLLAGPFPHLAERLPNRNDLPATLVVSCAEEQKVILESRRKAYADVGRWLAGQREPVRREMSATSQALLRMNGAFQATCLTRGFTAAEIAAAPTVGARLNLAFQTILGRLPNEAEIAAIKPTMEEPSRERAEDLLWALMQTTEFLTF